MMNLLKYIVLIFISSISFAQVKVLEDYISVENNSSEVSNKIISNEDFLRVLIDEYYKLTFEEDLIDNELINYQIVKNEFDFNNINLRKNINHKFSFKSKKNNKYRYSNPLISKNKNYAIIYELDNPNGLSGGGDLILLKLENNKWKKIGILYSWMA